MAINFYWSVVYQISGRVLPKNIILKAHYYCHVGQSNQFLSTKGKRSVFFQSEVNDRLEMLCLQKGGIRRMQIPQKVYGKENLKFTFDAKNFWNPCLPGVFKKFIDNVSHEVCMDFNIFSTKLHENKIILTFSQTFWNIPVYKLQWIYKM